MGREKTTSGRQQSIFKTDEGRQEILRYYHKLLVQNDFPYQEKYVDTSYGKTYLLEAGDPMPPRWCCFTARHPTVRHGSPISGSYGLRTE